MRTTLSDAPFEEARLAEELARLMRRAPRPVARPKPRPRPAPRRPVPPGSTREALATLLVRHANPLTPSRLSVPRAEPAAPSAAEVHAKDGDRSCPAASTADWLQRARRRRLRRRIAEAASWSLTVTVGALIIAAAVWMLLGWPNDFNWGQRIGAFQTRAAS